MGGFQRAVDSCLRGCHASTLSGIGVDWRWRWWSETKALHTGCKMRVTGSTWRLGRLLVSLTLMNAAVDFHGICIRFEAIPTLLCTQSVGFEAVHVTFIAYRRRCALCPHAVYARRALTGDLTAIRLVCGRPR